MISVQWKEQKKCFFFPPFTINSPPPLVHVKMICWCIFSLPVFLISLWRPLPEIFIWTPEIPSSPSLPAPHEELAQILISQRWSQLSVSLQKKEGGGDGGDRMGCVVRRCTATWWPSWVWHCNRLLSLNLPFVLLGNIWFFIDSRLRLHVFAAFWGFCWCRRFYMHRGIM